MGIEGSEKAPTGVEHLTDALMEIASRQWGGNRWPLTTGEFKAADEMCTAMAENLLAKFDISSKNALAARLQAFGRDCVHHGDMTPSAARMLEKIADELVL